MRKVLFAALLGLAALGVQAATLRWAAQNDVLTLDPHSQNHTTSIAIQQHAYEGLTRYSSDYKLQPALAESWKEISPTQVRFNLRRNVKFHDGSPFTADDVVFSYHRIKQPQGTQQVYVNGVADVRKIDDYTVDFILEGPAPILLRNLVYFRIMSKSWSEKNRSQNVQDYAKKEETYASRNVNGTGPFMIKSWEPDKRVVFEAFKGYWGKVEGNITDMVYTPIKSDATRVSALLSGDVDLVTDLPTQDVERLRKDPKLKILDGNEARTIFLAMDQHNEELKYSSIKGRNPFKDVRVRQALNQAIDREAIKRVTMRGLSIPAGIMVPPGVQGWSKDIDTPEKYDPAGAKKLLAEAGYPGGIDFTLDCPNGRYVNDEKVCQAIVSMWAKAGINAKLNAIPFSNFIPKILNFDSSVYMLGWGVATLDANFTLQSLLHTKTTGADGSFNLGRVSDPKLDNIIDTLKFATDANGRPALLREGLVRVRDNYYYVPLHHQLRPWAMKKNVEASYDLLDQHHARFTRVK